jgi:hypothetical protein
VKGADDPSSDTSQDTKHEKERRVAAAPEPVPDWWGEFWKAYDHPNGDPSKRAHEAWLELVDAGTDPRNLILAAKAYKAGKERWRNSKQAHRWLKDGDWADWLDKVKLSNTALPEPKFAASIGAETRQWYRERVGPLTERLGTTCYRAWIAPLTVIDVQPEVIRFGTSAKFFIDYVRNNLDTDLQRVLGRSVQLEVYQGAAS